MSDVCIQAESSLPVRTATGLPFPIMCAEVGTGKQILPKRAGCCHGHADFCIRSRARVVRDLRRMPEALWTRITRALNCQFCKLTQPVATFFATRQVWILYAGNFDASTDLAAVISMPVCDSVSRVRDSAVRASCRLHISVQFEKRIRSASKR